MPFRPQRLSNERPLESGVGPARSAPLPHLVGVQEPEIQGDSLTAIPIGGAVTATVEVQGASSRAIPIGGTATGTAPGPSADSIAAIPIGGAVAVTVEVSASSTSAIPIGGAGAVTVEVGATSTKAIPIGGAVAVTVEVSAASTKAIPIGGTATGTAPMPLIETLTDSFDENYDLWTAQNGVGGSIAIVNNKLRNQIAATGGTSSAYVFSKLRYDARNARIRFGLNIANLSTNDAATINIADGAGNFVLSFEFKRTGASTGTAAIKSYGSVMATGAIDPALNTLWKFELDNTTYGITDAVRLYKSDGAGGWTLVVQQVGSLPSTQVNAARLQLRADKLIGATETTYAEYDEFNTIVAATTKAIPIGGSASAVVEVRGTGSSPIPIGGTATGLTQPTLATTVRAIPVGGSATGTVEVRGAASGAIPLAGAASGAVDVQASSTSAIPIAGSATGTVASGGSPILATTNLPIPISGSASGTVANPGGAHSRWRILVTGNAGSFAPSFAEVEFRATVAGADQAAGGTPSASSVFGAGYEATKGFDDNIATLWSSSANTVPQWLAYQFTGAVGVAEVFLRSRNDVSGEGPSAFSVQYSDDGITWITLWSVSGQTWAGAGASRAFAAPSVEISAQTTRAIPIGGFATGTVVNPIPPWERTDLGPDVIGGDLPTTTFIGLGPVAGLPRDNNTTTIAPPAQVFDGVALSFNQIVVNPAGFAGLIVGESVQRNSGTGFPSLLPLILTFGTPVRGFQITARTVDFDTGSMTAKDVSGNVLATVFFPVVGLAGPSQSITREIQLASNLIKTIELLPDSADYIAWNDMYLTVNHASGVGGWEETDLDIGVFAWASADDAPATAWSS